MIAILAAPVAPVSAMTGVAIAVAAPTAGAGLAAAGRTNALWSVGEPNGKNVLWVLGGGLIAVGLVTRRNSS